MEEIIHDRQVKKTVTSRQIIDKEHVTTSLAESDVMQLYSVVNIENSIPCGNIPNELQQIASTHTGLIQKCENHDSHFISEKIEDLSETDKRLAWQNYQKLVERGSTVKSSCVFKRHISFPFELKRPFSHQNNSTPPTSKLFVTPDAIGNVSKEPRGSKAEPKYLFGFGKHFLSVLERKARNLHPGEKDKKIFGEIVPNILFDLYDSMEKGDKTVKPTSIFF